MNRLNSYEKFKVKSAIKLCRTKLTEFRTEERRKVFFIVPKTLHAFIRMVSYKLTPNFRSTYIIMQVLGHRPYSNASFSPTSLLAKQIMRQMHAPESTDEAQYIKHLALFVSVSQCCSMSLS